MLLTPDGGFNRGSVVGKRVPGTWSRVLDVLVLWTCCVDDVRLPDTRVGPLAGTPSITTRYRGTDRRRRVIALAAPVAVGIPSPLALSRTPRRRSGEHAAGIPRVSQSPTDDNERDLREILLENDEPAPHLGYPSPPCSTTRRRPRLRGSIHGIRGEEPVQAQQREVSRNL